MEGDKEVNYVVQSEVLDRSRMVVVLNSASEDFGETNVDDSDVDSAPPTTVTVVSDDGTRGLQGHPRSMVFKKAEEVVARVVAQIEASQELCTSSNKPASKDPSERRDLYTRAKDALTNESRQFVTASKLFVKSATESEGQLLECLSHCVSMIERIGALTRDVALLTPTPLQTQTLLAKVRDVANTYLETVQAAGLAVNCRDMNDPSMGVLMKKATLLASVLTTLMRSLRVFT